MGKKSQKPKIVLPPELPPEILEEEIEVSDDDLQFVKENSDYAVGVSRLDTQSITKHVTRVADVKEDALEALYEKRLKKKALQKEKVESGLQVDPVDALPVKTLDGKLYYRTLQKTSILCANSEEETGEDKKGDSVDKGIVKLTKVERRAKLKKQKKETKKQGKELDKAEEVQQMSQAAVLAEVKEDLTAEEAFESKKQKLAELGMALLADPESNIKSLKEMLQISKDNDDAIVKLGVLSLLAVFKDIIPGYRIRLPTEKELEMKVSKSVKKMRYYESTLLSVYKAFLQKLIVLEKKPSFQQVAVRCICTLLDAVPHFNFRGSLLAFVIRNIGSSDNVVRKLCCATITSLFTNEGKHGGEATVEAVRLIADHVKAHNCQLHPDSIEVFLSLSFDDNLGRPEKTNENNRVKNKKFRKRKHVEEPSQLPDTDKKRSRKEQMTKMREEVAADYKAASFMPDVMEQRRMQSETLSAVFETYFRILKHSVQPKASRDQGGVLAEALKMMLCEDRQHDMQKAAAFVKRLATFSLCFGSAESMAALVTLKHLLQKNVKCRNLLENDAGGGSVSGSIAKYRPYASDPNLSGALASVLWELNLLSKHYHPAVSAMASSVSSTSTGHNQVYLSIISPQQAFFDLSLEGESFNLQSDSLKLNNKRKRGSGSSRSACVTPLTDTVLVSDDEVRKKLSTHFMLLRDIKENERLRGDLDRTTFYLKLYEEHKKQRRKKGRTKPMKTEKNC
ncbi:nucleolar complex protein 3 homolog isoform X2 [Carya illinoinensis]|uniref:nucleolar complex protein 3 homolog isoform X2 n=1 Tax=Carya illinoinensis TaxID=32201 RepID=UPI001C71BEAB|nr:nucleolar complex protein 3 homolog isoform X2 [Carya illinoinensis]